VTDKAEGQNVNPASASVRGVPCQEATPYTDAAVLHVWWNKYKRSWNGINDDGEYVPAEVSRGLERDMLAMRRLALNALDDAARVCDLHASLSRAHLADAQAYEHDRYLIQIQIAESCAEGIRALASSQGTPQDVSPPDEQSPAPDEHLRIAALAVHPIWGRGN
jgi:hypothetical protein